MDKLKHRSEQYQNIDALVGQELNFANSLYDLFTSPMEGLGVIEEERYEANKELKQMATFYDSFRHYLCQGANGAAAKEAVKMGLQARKAAQELLQVAAMCEKFNLSETLW